MELYCDRLVPSKFAAVTYGPVSFFREQYRNDIGLRRHEAVHRRQFWMNPIFHGLLYLSSANYRLDAETEAYCEQLKYAPGSLERFTEFIATKYRMPESISCERIRSKLAACDGGVLFEAIMCNAGIALCLTGLLSA